MQSQLDISKKSRMVNLIIVSYGDAQIVNRLLSSIRQQFVQRLKTLPIIYYSDKTLALAEADPSLLQSRRNPSIRISRNDFSRKYIGFANCEDYYQLHKYLYSSCGSSATGCEYTYYTPSALSKIVHQNFDSIDHDVYGTDEDFVIDLTHTILEERCAYAFTAFQIKENLVKDDFDGYLNWLRSVIVSLDSSFSDVLQSAYITLNPSHMPITHTKVYSEYDFTLCNRYLLGAEWYIYLGKSIASYLDTQTSNQLKEVAVLEALGNGMTCTANVSILSFGSRLRVQMSNILKELLIPAFGVYNWFDLHRQEWTVYYLPQTIHVYYAPWSKYNPTIVFSHRCDADEITALKGINPSNLLNSFVLKK